MAGNRIRIRRAELRTTQMQLAVKTRINATKVWKIENGYAEPTVAERAAIAAALQTTEDEIWSNRAAAVA